MPKLETCVVIVKGLCFVTIGVFTPWAAALAQWIGTNSWPEKIVWIGVILPASAVGGASQLQSFLSGSFTTYRNQKQNGSDTQQFRRADFPESKPTPADPPKP